MRGVVLIVEDDELQVALWRRELEGRGYVVEDYAHSRDVHDRLDEGNGLVAAILDYRLPGSPGSGLSILQDLRAREDYVDLPVVMISGSWERDVRDEAERLGARTLEKPGASPAALVHSLLSQKAWDRLEGAVTTILARPPCLTEPRVVELLHEHVVPVLVSRAPRHLVEVLGGWRRVLAGMAAGAAGLLTVAYYVGAGSPALDAIRKVVGW